MTSSQQQVTEIAVVMNYFTGFEFMRESLESLAKQDWPFTLYFLDNASETSPVSLLDEFRDQFTINYKRLDEHVPLYEARNFALKLVQERIVAFMDVDDVWKPRKLSTQAKHLLNGNFSLTFTGFNTIARDSSVQKNVRFPSNYSCPVSAKELAKRYSVAMSSVMVTRDALEAVGGFDPTFEVIGDFDLLLKVADSGGVCYLREQLAFVRIHQKSTGHLARDLQIQEFEYWKSKNAEFFADCEAIIRHVDQEISVLRYVSSGGLSLPLFFKSLLTAGTAIRRLSIISTLMGRILKG